LITPYQDALLKFFRRLKWLGRSVPTVLATPDRAHGQMIEYLTMHRASSTGVDVDEIRKEFSEASIPRPFISVFMDWAGYDGERFTPFVHRGIVRDEVRGIALSVQEARPENFSVQADLWCGDDEHIANTLVGQLKSSFVSDDLPLPVMFGDARYYQPPYNLPEFCKYMGDITCRLIDEGVVDNSDRDGAVSTPKDIRKTFSGTLKGWLPRVPFEVKLVKKLVYSVEEDSSVPSVLLETATIDFVVP